MDPLNDGDYWNNWNSLPQNPWNIPQDNFAIHPLEAEFNQLNLSSNPPHQSRPIMTWGQSSTPALVTDQQSIAALYGGAGFRQPIASATPMGGGGSAFVRGSGSPGVSYQGTLYPDNNNIGYSDNNILSRMMMGELGSAPPPPVRGGRRPSIYSNVNPNLNQLSPDTLYNNNMSLYHRLNNNSTSSRNRNRNSNWAPFCIEQQLKNNSYSSTTMPMPMPMPMPEEGNDVYLMAKTQHGRRILQKILDEGIPENIHRIFCQVKDHVHDLMKDQFGNIMIQKMFEVCNAHQITELLRCLLRDERHLFDVCIDNHGTRAIQKLLGYLGSMEQRHMVLSCLRRITLHLTKDANGHHVIERCFDLFPREETMQILNVVAAHCVEIAANKSGCCLLQHCILNEEVINPLNQIVAEITANALTLSVDQYGNYVVQYIIGLKMDNATREIVAQLSGNFVSLSLDKYGSHVTEKCINLCPEDQAMKIIEEIITSPDFLAMLQDPYGNFVAQSAYRVSKGSIRAMMLHLIEKNHPSLHSHPHGKRVLDKIGFHPHQQGHGRRRTGRNGIEA